MTALPNALSISIVVDRSLAQSVSVTHAAAGWVRLVITLAPETAQEYISVAITSALCMLAALGVERRHLFLDGVLVSGPDGTCIAAAIHAETYQLLAPQVQALPQPQALPQAQPQAQAQAQALALPLPPQIVDRQIVRDEALARVRGRAARAGGAPNFALKTLRAARAGRNYIQSTVGNHSLQYEDLEYVYSRLAAESQ